VNFANKKYMSEPIKLPTRDILKPAFDALRAKFPDTSLFVGLKYQEDKNGSGKWKMEAPKYGHYVYIESHFFYGDTLEQAVESALNEFKPKDPARIAAAAALRKQADSVEKGESPIPQTP
jgi:hypothetical protein